jgi:hypothetical protein
VVTSVAVPGLSRAFRPATTAILALAILMTHGRAAQQDGESPGFSFTNVARTAGLDATITFGGSEANKYLLETTGTGVAFIDYDGDGWLDLFLANGHVYPEVDRIESEAGYKQPKVVYRNLQNGRFADVSRRLGPPVTTPKAARGAAFADFDNDGDVDVVVNNVHDAPDLYRLDRTQQHRWLTVKLVGTQSNRNAIGALVRLVTSSGEQRQEVRGGGSYYSQNDFRLHFSLARAGVVHRLIIRWPNGLEEEWNDLQIDRAHTLAEGSGRALPATR